MVTITYPGTPTITMSDETAQETLTRLKKITDSDGGDWLRIDTPDTTIRLWISRTTPIAINYNRVIPDDPRHSVWLY